MPMGAVQADRWVPSAELFGGYVLVLECCLTGSVFSDVDPRDAIWSRCWVLLEKRNAGTTGSNGEGGEQVRIRELRYRMQIEESRVVDGREGSGSLDTRGLMVLPQGVRQHSIDAAHKHSSSGLE